MMEKRKVYASLLVLGAGILLYRTIRLLTAENGWETLAAWVIALTFIEMGIDLLCIVFAIRWLAGNGGGDRKAALRLGAAAAFFHAFRVLIYVMGRLGPFSDFDLKPRFRGLQPVEMFWVYFASILSVMGVIGVLVIRRRIRKGRDRAA